MPQLIVRRQLQYASDPRYFIQTKVAVIGISVGRCCIGHDYHYPKFLELLLEICLLQSGHVAFVIRRRTRARHGRFTGCGRLALLRRADGCNFLSSRRWRTYAMYTLVLISLALNVEGCRELSDRVVKMDR